MKNTDFLVVSSVKSFSKNHTFDLQKLHKTITEHRGLEKRTSEAIAALPDKQKYNRLKVSLLPAAMLSVLNSSGLKDKQITELSSFLQIDIDDIAEKETIKAISYLNELPYVAFVFKTGTGVKAIGVVCRSNYLLNSEQDIEAARLEQRVFYHRLKLELAELNYKIDSKTEDLSRRCFLWYDPKAIMKPLSEVVPLEINSADWENYKKTNTNNLTEPRKSASNKKDTPSMMMMMENGAHIDKLSPYSNKDIAEKVRRLAVTVGHDGLEYDDWYKAFNGVANSCGIEFAKDVFKEHFPETEKGEYDKKLHSRTDQHSAGTLDYIARKHGVDFSDLKPDAKNTQSQHANTKDIAINEGILPLQHAGKIEFNPKTPYLIKGILNEQTTSVIYGNYGTAKTFLTLDIAASIATGQPWRGHNVRQGAVLYLCLEGQQGINNRVLALRKKDKLPREADVLFCSMPLSLVKEVNVERIAITLLELMKQLTTPVKLLVIDTLARAIAGGNENSNEDMSSIVAACDRIRNETSVHILFVHHDGKDASKGMRGASALPAAVETSIKITEKNNIHTLEIDKQKDLSKGNKMTFELETVELGIDDEGDPVTSCVVHHNSDIENLDDNKQGRPPEYLASSLLEFLPQSTVSDWQKKAASKSKMSKSTFTRLKKQLIKGSDYENRDGTLVSIEKQSSHSELKGPFDQS